MQNHLDTMSNGSLNRRTGLDPSPAQRLENDMAQADRQNAASDLMSRRIRHAIVAVAAAAGIMGACDQIAQATQEVRQGVTTHDLAEQILGREIRE